MSTSPFIERLRSESADLVVGAVDRDVETSRAALTEAVGILAGRLEELPPTAKRTGTALDTIVEVVAGVLGEPCENLFVVGRREQRFVWPRQVALYCARMMTTHSAPALARHFGLQDHSTVLYSEQVVPNKLCARADERVRIERIEALLRARLPQATDAAKVVALHIMRPRQAVA